MATNPVYQKENMDIWSFNLTGVEMDVIANLPTMPTPPPPPTPPPTPSPLQRNCTFELKATDKMSGFKIVLKELPQGEFNLTDRVADKYVVTSPCGSAQDTTSPALETW
jgi:hypothetical protein